jgi:predicted MFS family arabinose efflux permease
MGYMLTAGKYGRKAGMMYCAFFSLLGGALLCGANGVAMFITARFFVSLLHGGILYTHLTIL